MKRLRMAVVGVGHLGKEHARILATMPEAELVGVADANLEQAQTIARQLNTVAFPDYESLISHVDAASIVVPTTFHLPVASVFLRAGVPVLVEKPLAPTSAAAQELVDLARQHRAVLQVGHIERFNPAFEELTVRPITPTLIRAERMGPFTGRSTDIGVVLDLMIHDLDLILALVKAPLVHVDATGLSVFGGHEDIASARLTFADGCVAEVMASRASPKGTRLTRIWGQAGYAEIDYAARSLTVMQPSEELQRHGLVLDVESRARLRDELFSRHLKLTTIDGKAQDQLTCELRDFVQCVQTGTPPRVTGNEGLAAVRVAEAIVHAIHGGSQTLSFQKVA